MAQARFVLSPDQQRSVRVTDHTGDGSEEMRMEILLGASLSSFIAACVAVFVLEPRVQNGEHPSSPTEHRPGADSATRH
jgi:hypothetical protein